MSEPFFSRWSRLKRRATQTPAAPEAPDGIPTMAPEMAPAAPAQHEALAALHRGATAPAAAGGALDGGISPRDPSTDPRIDPPADPQTDGVLPDIGTLTADSDFAPFMQRQVNETVRRQALRTLFADPRFNVMDGLDVYIDDYSVSDPIPPEMLAGLEQAKRLFGLQAPGEDAAEVADGADVANIPEIANVRGSAGVVSPALHATISPPAAACDADTLPATSEPVASGLSGQAALPAANCDNLSIDGQIVAIESDKSA